MLIQIPDSVVLEVNGVEIAVPYHHDYVIRFCIEGNRAIPVLYYKAKRVTDEWSLVIIHKEPKDPYGRSA